MLLTQEENKGDMMLGGGGGGGSMPMGDNGSSPSTAPKPSDGIGTGRGGVVLSAENWSNLKDNLMTLSDKLSAKEKSGYKDTEVNNMPDTTELKEETVDIEALQTEIMELVEANKILEESLEEASAAIDSAAAFIEENKVDADRLSELEAFTAEADSIINDIEAEKLGQERLSLMTELVGDAYAENDASELAKMDESTFAHIYESMTKVIQKIEDAASAAETEIESEEVIEELTEDEMKNTLAEVVSQLDSSNEPDLVVKASKSDSRSAARNLIRNAIQR